MMHLNEEEEEKYELKINVWFTRITLHGSWCGAAFGVQ